MAFPLHGVPFWVKINSPSLLISRLVRSVPLIYGSYFNNKPLSQLQEKTLGGDYFLEIDLEQAYRLSADTFFKWWNL